MIARVFARKTPLTPTDDHAYYDYKKEGDPERFAVWKPSTPIYDEVCVSCTFTWDIVRAKMLAELWKHKSKTPVKLGGPAFGDPGATYTPGMFLKNNVVMSSRGCPASCSFCVVPTREGKIRELPITEGNIIQDNNILACSRGHIEKVFDMLRKQKNIEFTGGIDCTRLREWHIDLMRGIKLKTAWLAFDTEEKRNIFKDAAKRLRKYFKIRQICAYVLIGYEGDTIQKAEERLRFAFECGALPFAMRYRMDSGMWAGTYLYKQREWNILQHNWTRKEIIFGSMK